jgi:hypothetical protein
VLEPNEIFNIDNWHLDESTRRLTGQLEDAKKILLYYIERRYMDGSGKRCVMPAFEFPNSGCFAHRHFEVNIRRQSDQQQMKRIFSLESNATMTTGITHIQCVTRGFAS